MKVKKLALFSVLGMAGLGYFQAVSGWEINFLLKEYAAIAGLQVAALLYVGYVYWNRRSQTAPSRDSHLRD
jgi:hypothetical protein